MHNLAPLIKKLLRRPCIFPYLGNCCHNRITCSLYLYTPPGFHGTELSSGRLESIKIFSPMIDVLASTALGQQPQCP